MQIFSANMQLKYAMEIFRPNTPHSDKYSEYIELRSHGFTCVDWNPTSSGAPQLT